MQKIRNIPSDRLLAERLWYVFTTCGTNAMVVRVPATRPRILTGSMIEIKCGENIHGPQRYYKSATGISILHYNIKSVE